MYRSVVKKSICENLNTIFKFFLCMYIHSFSDFFFLYRLLQNIKQNSLYYYLLVIYIIYSGVYVLLPSS